MDVVGYIKSWWETTDSEGRFIIVNRFVLPRCISVSVACVAQPGRGGGVACVACVARVAQPGRGGGVACVACVACVAQPGREGGVACVVQPGRGGGVDCVACVA